LLPDPPARDALLRDLRAQNIHAVFHYVPLHSSPAGRRLGLALGDLRVTDSVSKRIIRLPLFAGIRDDQVERVIEVVSEGVARRAHPA
jgi:dTDP-4-amino-4,6-dideoxygalactose transaminase